MQGINPMQGMDPMMGGQPQPAASEEEMFANLPPEAQQALLEMIQQIMSGEISPELAQAMAGAQAEGMPQEGPPMQGPPMQGPPMQGPPMQGPPMAQQGPPMMGPPVGMSAGGEVPARGEETLEELHRQINESKRKLKDREKLIREEATAVGGNPRSFSQAPVGFADGGEVPSVSLEPESLGVDEGGLWDAYGAGALSLEQLRKAVDALKQKEIKGQPVLLRGRKDVFDRPAYTGVRSPGGDRPIISVRGDTSRRFAPMRDLVYEKPPSYAPTFDGLWSGRIEGPVPAAYEKLSGPQKEAFNRSVLLHEGAELKAAQRPASELTSFKGHLGLAPPLQDMNIAAALSDEYAPTAKAIRQLRFPERGMIENVVPGSERLGLGENRISRHAIKRLGEAYKRLEGDALPNLLKQGRHLTEEDPSLRAAKGKIYPINPGPTSITDKEWESIIAREAGQGDDIPLLPGQSIEAAASASERDALSKRGYGYGGEDSSIPPAYEKLDRHGEIVRESDMPSYHSDEWVAKEITPEMAKAKKVTPLLKELHNVPLNLRDFGPNLAEGFHDPSELSRSYPPGPRAETFISDTLSPIPEPATVTLGDPLTTGEPGPWRDGLHGRAGRRSPSGDFAPYVPENVDPNSPWGRYLQADANRLLGRVEKETFPMLEGMDTRRVEDVVHAGPGPTRFRTDWVKDSPEFLRSIAKESDKFLPMQSKIARAAAPYARGLAKGIGAAGAVIGPSIPAYELGRQWESSVMDDGIMDRFGSANKRAGLANAMQRKPEMFAPGAFEAYSSMTDADWDKMSGFGQGYIERGKAYSPGPLEFWNSPLYFPKNKRDLAAAWPKHAGPIPKHLMPDYSRQ